MGIQVGAEGRFYVSCPAGTTALKQKTGAAGDVITALWIAGGAGNVVLKDGVTAVFTFTAESVERYIPLDLVAKGAGWSVEITGVSALASGNFS